MQNQNETHEQALQLLNLKAGDTVRVLRKAESISNGWRGRWIPEMDLFVGKKCKVLTINSLGVLLEDDNDEAWYFPAFVLEKVEAERTENDPHCDTCEGLRLRIAELVTENETLRDNMTILQSLQNKNK